MKEFLNALKPIFPVTFSLDKFVKLEFASNAELFNMLVQIVVYVVASIIFGVVIGVIWALIPFLGFVWGIVSTVAGLYVLAGIVLSVLDYLKILDKVQ